MDPQSSIRAAIVVMSCGYTACETLSFEDEANIDVFKEKDLWLCTPGRRDETVPVFIRSMNRRKSSFTANLTGSTKYKRELLMVPCAMPICSTAAIVSFSFIPGRDDRVPTRGGQKSGD